MAAQDADHKVDIEVIGSLQTKYQLFEFTTKTTMSVTTMSVTTMQQRYNSLYLSLDLKSIIIDMFYGKDNFEEIMFSLEEVKNKYLLDQNNLKRFNRKIVSPNVAITNIKHEILKKEKKQIEKNDDDDDIGFADIERMLLSGKSASDILTKDDQKKEQEKQYKLELAKIDRYKYFNFNTYNWQWSEVDKFYEIIFQMINEVLKKFNSIRQPLKIGKAILTSNTIQEYDKNKKVYDLYKKKQQEQENLIKKQNTILTQFCNDINKVVDKINGFNKRDEYSNHGYYLRCLSYLRRENNYEVDMSILPSEPINYTLEILEQQKKDFTKCKEELKELWTKLKNMYKTIQNTISDAHKIHAEYLEKECWQYASASCYFCYEEIKSSGRCDNDDCGCKNVIEADIDIEYINLDTKPNDISFSSRSC
jgi:hypothetical protein